MTTQFIVRHPNFNTYLHIFDNPQRIVYSHNDITTEEVNRDHEWVKNGLFATLFIDEQAARTHFTSPLCGIVSVVDGKVLETRN